MKKNELIIVLLTIFMYSCKSNCQDIQLFRSNGLSNDNLNLDRLIFLNKDIGFASGSIDQVTANPDKTSMVFAFVKRQSILYKTINGGKSWSERHFGEGVVSKITLTSLGLFLVKYNDSLNQSTIYNSIDSGGTWSDKFVFPNIVSNIFVIDDKIFIIARDSTIGQYSLFQNDSRYSYSWKRVDIILPIYHGIETSKRFYYISSSDPLNNREYKLVFYEASSGIIENIKLPEGFRCSFLKVINEKVYLTGLENSRISVYSVNNDNKLIREVYFSEGENHFPKDIVQAGNNLIILSGIRKNTVVSNILLIYNKKNDNWEKKSFDKDEYVNPFFFLTTGSKVTGWFYSGSGIFQQLNRDFKD